MVRALRDGSKTQTRRATGLAFVNENPGCWLRQWVPAQDGKHWLFTCGDDSVQLRCPYGVEGDRLWVRETMRSTNDGDDYAWHYAADGEPLDFSYETEAGYDLAEAMRPIKKPCVVSIHMPRAASRLLLEITAVRVERVQAISIADAKAEGIEIDHSGDWGNGYKDYLCKDGSVSFGSAVASYESLWASINGPASWAANPWVWVVEFKVLEGGKEVASA
jgi:hypothetical protein